MNTGNQEYRRKKNIYYLAAFAINYLFPLIYFIIKLGITQQATKIVMPVVLMLVLIVFKIGGDIPRWVATWEPSFKKGLIIAIPKILLFIVLISLGVAIQYILERHIETAFSTYYETVLVLFGSMSVGSIFDALHLKYKELYLISKGYVLGVVNRG